jgi:hypothetical protein
LYAEKPVSALVLIVVSEAKFNQKRQWADFEAFQKANSQQ